MVTQTLMLELPEELVSMIGSPEAATAKAGELLVIELLREARISQGKAAELLGINRWEMMKLAARHQIPSVPRTTEELLQDVENARQARDT